MDCPYCGSKNVEYRGLDDGGGDFGTSIIVLYRCDECGTHFEDDVYDYGFIEDPYIDEWAEEGSD